MINIYKLFLSFIFISAINSLAFAQEMETRSLGEITFTDNLYNGSYNKVYLLFPGNQVTIKNTGPNEQIAIGFKKYLDISSELALVYRERDLLSSQIISRYQEIGKTIDSVSQGLSRISETLDTVSKRDLEPSIVLLDKSHSTLKAANKDLSDAVAELGDISSQINKINTANIWKYVGFGAGGTVLGLLIGALVFK
jgi:peptidoglycan hydrolase CwlO-like protein